jgi:hypothetical protein
MMLNCETELLVDDCDRGGPQTAHQGSLEVRQGNENRCHYNIFVGRIQFFGSVFDNVEVTKPMLKGAKRGSLYSQAHLKVRLGLA